jgi:GNAT superfamily N-acetyltransferase
MTLTFARDPELSTRLREEIVQIWTDASNAGGAVGFVPPVTAEDVRPVAEKQFEAVGEGAQRLLVAYEEGRAIGTVFLKLNTHRLMRHWCTVVTVMVDPALQGGGRGRRMMNEAVDFARDLGFDALRLGVRGGTGVDAFYAGCGFKEVGRVPDAIRVAADDFRDDIAMWLPLH